MKPRTLPLRGSSLAGAVGATLALLGLAALLQAVQA